ncbi:MAG TPA: HIT domain-containing protein [Anaerolineales bacterium]|nr:HIT domain-containing protein [Anaerolineales bacterium]
MNHLWSPWRMKYLEGNKKEEGCVFCKAQEMPDSAENLIAYRSERAYVILNRYPYTSGHLLVNPYQHVTTLEELDSDTRAEMMELASRCTTVLKSIYKPQGFNVGVNMGAAAGAGVPEHIHLHVVPRWSGDTTFMTTLGKTRVLPEELETTYERIKHGFQKRT